jgi:hypothetical protein
MKNSVVSIVSLMVLASGCNSSDNIIGLNENIHHDDFNYRVTAVEKRKSIIADSVKMLSGGNFYIVTFAAQQLLNTKEPFDWHSTYNTGHGSSERTRLVFDVPGNPSELYLKVHGETLMGDVFNLNRFKRIKIKLL